MHGRIKTSRKWKRGNGNNTKSPWKDVQGGCYELRKGKDTLRVSYERDSTPGAYLVTSVLMNRGDDAPPYRILQGQYEFRELVLMRDKGAVYLRGSLSTPAFREDVVPLAGKFSEQLREFIKDHKLNYDSVP